MTQTCETRSAARRLVVRSCRAQGLPERLTDPAALDRVAHVLTGCRRKAAHR
jgi:hypothetical protein